MEKHELGESFFGVDQTQSAKLPSTTLPDKPFQPFP